MITIARCSRRVQQHARAFASASVPPPTPSAQITDKHKPQPTTVFTPSQPTEPKPHNPSDQSHTNSTNSSIHKQATKKKKKFFRRVIPWTVLVLGAAGYGMFRTLFGDQHHDEDPTELESAEYLVSPWKSEVLKRVPFSLTSRTWGAIARVELPQSLREPVYRLYGNAFKVNFDEVELPLREYPSLAQFFARRLKQGSRPIDASPSEMASPVDGRVIYYGVAQKDTMEQVKGVTYSLERFLGPSDFDLTALLPNAMLKHGGQGDAKDKNDATSNITNNSGSGSGSSSSNDTNLHQKQNTPDASKSIDNEQLLETKMKESAGTLKVSMPDHNAQKAAGSLGETPQQVALQASVEAIKQLEEDSGARARKLYHIGIYLAPGDYHGFHSPVDWTVETRRHFPGYLFPVAPVVVRSVQGLFALNERVILTGKWKHGFFAFAPVGASNVGSIRLAFDSSLATNKAGRVAKDGSVYHDRDVDFEHPPSPSSSPSSSSTTSSSAAVSSAVRGLGLRKGAEIGFFHMGSTVVMIFEVPADHEFHFTVKPGQKVVLGKSIGYIAPVGSKKK